MKTRRTRASAATAVLSAVAGLAMAIAATSPARANVAIGDPSGVDWVPGCLNQVGPPSANSVASPSGTGCTTAVYDGSTEGLDLQDSTLMSTPAASLASDAAGHVVARWTLDGAVPAPGDTTPPASSNYDLPGPSFVGGTYFALYNNATKQTTVPYPACTRLPATGGPSMYQRWGSWQDGFHFFVAYSITYFSGAWVHQAYVGEYVPGPTSGFRFFDLGASQTATWTATNPNHPYDGATPAANEWNATISGTGPTVITVTAPGNYLRPDAANCVQGYFEYRMAAPGDAIENVKALTTAVPAPMAPSNPPNLTCHVDEGTNCSMEVIPVSDFSFTDTTAGQSTIGTGNTNIAGIAYSFSANATASDTTGPGPTCGFPTSGGATPQHPLWTPNTPCHVDDDNTVAHGSTRPEWWATAYDFTF